MSGQRLGDNSDWGWAEASAQTIGEYGCAQIHFKLQEKRGGMEFATLIGIMNQTTELETCLLN